MNALDELKSMAKEDRSDIEYAICSASGKYPEGREEYDRCIKAAVELKRLREVEKVARKMAEDMKGKRDWKSTHKEGDMVDIGNIFDEVDQRILSMYEEAIK